MTPIRIDSREIPQDPEQERERLLEAIRMGVAGVRADKTTEECEVGKFFRDPSGEYAIISPDAAFMTIKNPALSPDWRTDIELAPQEVVVRFYNKDQEIVFGIVESLSQLAGVARVLESILMRRALEQNDET